MNIAITGFMATGKTEISKELSCLLGYKRVDTDDEIVKMAGMSINEIFAKFGEAYFRRLECEISAKMSELQDTVISTGGGLVLNKENLAHLRKNGVIVNLDADFSVIEQRIEKAAATRPLMKGSSIEDIKKRFYARAPFYADCDFKIQISNGKTPKEHAQMIIAELRNRNLI